MIIDFLTDNRGRWGVLLVEVFATLWLHPFAHALSTEQKLSDLEQFFSDTKTYYAPLELKQKNGLNLDKLQKQYSSLASKTQNDLQFSYLLVQLAAELNDFHFTASVPSNSRATIGIQTDLFGGKVLVTSVLPDYEAFVKVGDEITEVNAKPVASELKRLMKYVGRSNESSRMRRTATYLFERPGKIFPQPFGPVSITVKPADGSEEKDLEFDWKQNGLSWDEKTNADPEGTIGGTFSYCSNSSRLPIPNGAMPVTTAPLTSYIVSGPQGKIGYVRIGNLEPSVDFPKDPLANLKRFKQMELIVSKMEQSSDGLIIDLDQNCGGSIVLAQMFLTLFIGQPFQPFQFEISANPLKISFYETFLSNTTPATIEAENANRVLNLVKASVANHQKLTPKTSIDGAISLFPNGIRYTKPILILVDNLTVSAAEMFAASMQDYRRALILGSTSGGAGGSVRALEQLNYSKVSLRVTDSIFYRLDGSALEGRGITPDIRYSIGVADFRSGYRLYSQFIYDQMTKLIGKKSPSIILR